MLNGLYTWGLTIDYCVINPETVLMNIFYILWIDQGKTYFGDMTFFIVQASTNTTHSEEKLSSNWMLNYSNTTHYPCQIYSL